MKYKSVLIHGNLNSIVELDKKAEALNVIMEKYSGRNDFTYNNPALVNVAVFEIAINKVESRVYGY
jgi:uncharacterized protein